MKSFFSALSGRSTSTAIPAASIDGVVVQGADRITRRVSRREDCTPEETSKITEICNLLGTNNIESKLRPLRLVWEMAAEDDVKYKSSFLEFLTDLNSKLINIMNNASNDVKTNLCSNLNATPIIASKFYLLVFKSESLLGTSINHFSIEELIECAYTHKELDVLTHNYTLHLIQKGIITPKRALNLLYTSLENNPLQDVITKMQQVSSPSI